MNVKLYALIAYASILFLPTVILNGSYWGQCDCIYTTFAILALLNLLKDKYFKAFIFLGMSFAFKLQFVFLLPVFIFVYASKRKFPLYYFLIIPLVDLILCLPAILNGKTILDCLTLYINQSSSYPTYISMLFPGIFNLVMVPYNDYVSNSIEGLGSLFVVITLSILFLVLVTIIYKKTNLKNEKIIHISLWAVMICTFLLPNMHERYLFMGDVLAVLYFIVARDWKKIYIPIGISLISLYGYIRMLFGGQILDIQIISLLNLSLVAIITKDVFRSLLNEEKIELEERKE